MLEEIDDERIEQLPTVCLQYGGIEQLPTVCLQHRGVVLGTVDEHGEFVVRPAGGENHD